MHTEALMVQRYQRSAASNRKRAWKNGAKFPFFFFSAILSLDRFIPPATTTTTAYVTFLRPSFSSLRKFLPFSRSTLNYARASFSHRSPSCPTLKTSPFFLFFFSLVSKLRYYGEKKKQFEAQNAISIVPRAFHLADMILQGRVNARTWTRRGASAASEITPEEPSREREREQAKNVTQDVTTSHETLYRELARLTRFRFRTQAGLDRTSSERGSSASHTRSSRPP